MRAPSVVQGDSAVPEANMYVVNIGGQPIWEIVVNGVVLRGHSGRKLLEDAKRLLEPSR